MLSLLLSLHYPCTKKCLKLSPKILNPPIENFQRLTCCFQQYVGCSSSMYDIRGEFFPNFRLQLVRSNVVMIVQHQHPRNKISMMVTMAQTTRRPRTSRRLLVYTYTHTQQWRLCVIQAQHQFSSRSSGLYLIYIHYTTLYSIVYVSKGLQEGRSSRTHQYTTQRRCRYSEKNTSLLGRAQELLFFDASTQKQQFSTSRAFCCLRIGQAAASATGGR